MSRIFISHSSANNLQAVAVGAWLGSHGDNGWDDYFLDLDPERGLKAGERWQERLRTQGERCEAVIFLISKAWLKSKWCLAEFLLAKQLNKKIFGVQIEAVPIAAIPVEMSAEWQLCNLASKGETEAIACVFEEKPRTVKFSRDGLARLKHGLTQAGIDPRSFKFPQGREPYRGLKPLELEDAAIFFGRDAQILRALDRIRGMRNAGPEKLLVIVGASGSGKSSFLRAGLLRRLQRDDRNFFALAPVRPLGKAISGGQGLAASLESGFAILRKPRSRGALIESLREGGGALAKAVADIRELATARLVDPAKPVTVVLPIDQGEELLDGSVETERLIGHLAGALGDKRLQSGGLIVILTIRSDRFEGLQKNTHLGKIAAMEFGLPPVAMTSYREIIERPALVFEKSGGKLELKPDLIDAIAADAAKGGADALPLLAFTLERLYSLYGKDGSLVLDEYEKLGRMEGAIAVAVNEAVPVGEQHKLRHAFIPHLAVVDPKTLEPRRSPAKLADLPEDARPLIGKMVDSHLLIEGRVGEDAVIELAHDSLLKAWDDLRGWLREDQDLLALRETVREAAGAWVKKGRSDDRLIHRGTPLKEAEALLGRPDLIDTQSTEYLTACRKREDNEERARKDAIDRERAQLNRTRRLQRFTGATLFAGLAAVLVGAWLVVTLTGNFLDARARLVAEAAMTQQDGDHFDSSLRLALLARKTASRPPIEASKEATLQQIEKLGAEDSRSKLGSVFSRSALAKALQATRQVATLNGHTAAVASVAFSRDGSRIVTASSDNTARLWDAEGKEIAVLKGHEDSVRSAAFNADGSRIVTASIDKTARLWDAEGKEIAVLKGHEKRVTSAAFNADGSRIVTVSDDKTARLWDAEGKAIAVLKGHEGRVTSAAFSAAGSRIVTASWERTARLWDAEGKQIAVLEGHEDNVTSAAFSADGSRIVTASWDKTARLWDAEGKQITVLKGHEGWVNSAVFNADGSRIVTASTDKTARLWDAEGKEIAVLKGHEDIVWSAAFNADGSRIVTASWDTTARLWDAEGKPIAVLKGHEGPVWSADFNASGSRIVTASDDKTARLWDGEGKEIAVLSGHENGVDSATFSADGSRIVTASSDKTARLWDAGGKAIAVLKGHEESVRSAAFNADGSRIVTVSYDKTARLWDAAGKAIAVLKGHESWVDSAAFNADGSRIVTASSDKTARLWDAGGKAIAVLSGHENGVNSATFSADGSRIVTASDDTTARLWDGEGKEIAVLSGHENGVNSATFSADGSRIVTASSDKTARLWDAEGKAIAVLKGHEDKVTSAAFNSAGSRIVTASDDNTARLWDAEGKVIAVLRGHEGNVTSAAFNADGSRIVTASWDKTARLWDAEGNEIAVLKGHAGYVWSAAFNTDGNRIVTASDDKTARIWDVSHATNPSFDDLARIACARYLKSPNGKASRPTDEELRLVGFEDEFETPPDLCAEYR